MNQALDAWSLTLPPYFQLEQQPSSGEQWYLFARSRLWWRLWNLKDCTLPADLTPARHELDRPRVGHADQGWG